MAYEGRKESSGLWLTPCAKTTDSLRRQIDSRISDMKINVIRDVEERIHQSVKGTKVGVKSDLEDLKLDWHIQGHRKS